MGLHRTVYKKRSEIKGFVKRDEKNKDRIMNKIWKEDLEKTKKVLRKLRKKREKELKRRKVRTMIKREREREGTGKKY